VVKRCHVVQHVHLISWHFYITAPWTCWTKLQTDMQIFAPKSNLVTGLCPDPLGSLQHSLHTHHLARFSGKGKGGKGNGGGGEGRREDGKWRKDGKGKAKKGPQHFQKNWSWITSSIHYELNTTWGSCSRSLESGLDKVNQQIYLTNFLLTKDNLGLGIDVV